jgi:flagellar protein FlaG
MVAARLSPTDIGKSTSSQTIQASGVGTGSATAGTPSRPSLGADELKKLVVDMQTKLSGARSNLEFSVDNDTGRSVVKVTERTTNEVIWQFPSEQALQVSKELDRYLGAFVNRAV